MQKPLHFLRDCFTAATRGGPSFYLWAGFLSLLILIGAWAYTLQLRHGLIVTGLNDHVSWGLYISNFTFLVGLAAGAVMLVMPAYVLKDLDFSRAVLIGEGIAVGALIMCLCFVTADMGSPQNAWHLIPKIGYFNWPNSMLTWDVIVLNGYLALNIFVPAYILWSHWNGRHPNKKLYVPLMFVSVFWACSIHMVTAFLYASLVARPFWHTALLGPRFLASAFAGGPAFILITLLLIHKFSSYKIGSELFRKLALIVTIAAQANLIMLGSEAFVEFYFPSHHGISARYLFFGYQGHDALVPWIWTGIGLNILGTLLLTVHLTRRREGWRTLACALIFIGIWIEKGMGLIIPGFIPSPLGEIVEYHPSTPEILVTIGIWALGLLIMTLLIRAALSIELGHARAPGAATKLPDDH
ncbi:MAG: polysulfide reductase NrfD [Verrucomicrobiota bacterium]|jgi:molybdopterin-containing oxidoreductase family membrane subunit